jgi:putative methionine-R-sulfoxide reductase with GAF domain
MEEADKLALSNAIISLLLILSEFMGWSQCKSNSLSELMVNLFQRNKCIGRSDIEEQSHSAINAEP